MPGGSTRPGRSAVISTPRQTQKSDRGQAQATPRDAAAPAGPHAELVADVLAALDARGVPSGAWLVDIARVRKALQDADALMRRLEEAIIRDASSAPLGE